mgnify:CR=1 FL=1
MSRVSRPDIFYIHLLRAVAATAVIAIHVLGPYRFMYQQIPFDAWYSATAINSLSRWAVPIFMMITGALLIRPDQQLDLPLFFRKRLLKVLVPFLAWSLIYVGITGLQDGSAAARTALLHSPSEPVWYHLWFFYDFIPLYLVVLLLSPLIAKMNEQQLLILIAAWLTLTLAHLLKIPTPLRQSTILYSGYLVLGWYLFYYPSRKQLKVWVALGIAAMAVNLVGSWLAAEAKGKYSSMFMGYKTLNTAVIAAMLFVLAQQYGGKIHGRLHKLIVSVSTYSLGIYLVHPIFLIPVRTRIETSPLSFGHPALAIPALTLVTLLLAWGTTALLARVPVVRKLVP